MVYTKPQLFVFAGRTSAGKTTVIRRLFPGVRVVDSLPFVIPFRVSGEILDDKLLVAYGNMYAALAEIHDDTVVLELGTSVPEFNVIELGKLQEKFSIQIFLCVTSRETSDVRAHSRGLRGFSEEAHQRRLMRDFPNIYLEPLKNSGLSYRQVDMEGSLDETLEIFSRLTGRPVSLGERTPRYSAIITPGLGRAAEFGVPTANITLPDLHLSGVYAVRAELEGKTYEAAAYADPERNVLEANLFGFSGHAEGKMLTIELLKKIRERRKFKSKKALQAAINDDIVQVQKYFKKN